MRNPTTAALAVAVTFTLTSAANAQSHQSTYVGFSLGQTKLDDACRNNAAIDFPACDAKDGGMAAYGGWDFHGNFAVEGGYIDFGNRKTTTLIKSGGDSFKTKNKLRSVYIAGIGKVHWGERVTLFGKIGSHWWKADAKLSNADPAKFGDEGNDVFFGVGGQLSLPGGKFKVRLEYQIFEVKDAYKGKRFLVNNRGLRVAGSYNEFRFLSVGLVYAF